MNNLRAEVAKERHNHRAAIDSAIAPHNRMVADILVEPEAKITSARAALLVIDNFYASLGDPSFLADRLPPLHPLTQFAKELKA